LNARMEN